MEINHGYITILEVEIYDFKIQKKLIFIMKTETVREKENIQT